MVDAIVNLLKETSNQRDALTNAAEHLFSDMRVVSAGDLRINAPVTDDPIGMLANAFNFTVSRFRRFVLRVQTTVEQIDVITRQELERATQIRRTRERLQKISVEGIPQRIPTVQTLSEQVTRIVKEAAWQQSSMTEGIVKLHVRDVQMMEQLLQRVIVELRNAQQSTSKNLVELDRELMNLAHNMRKGKVSSPVVAPSSSKEQADLARLSISFATEVGTLARKLNALSQEMRTGIVSFQLDMPEQVSNPISHPGSANKIPANYTLPIGVLAPEQRSPAAPRPHHTTHPLS